MELKDNSGLLFKNDKKEGNQPDYQGEALIGGKHWKMSAWLKTSKKETKFLSFSFQEPYKGKTKETMNQETDKQLKQRKDDSRIPF